MKKQISVILASAVFLLVLAEYSSIFNANLPVEENKPIDKPVEISNSFKIDENSSLENESVFELQDSLDKVSENQTSLHPTEKKDIQGMRLELNSLLVEYENVKSDVELKGNHVALMKQKISKYNGAVLSVALEEMSK